MAIDQGTATLVVSSQERTWRVSIDTTMLSDPMINIQREEVKTDANGHVISKAPNAVVTRTLSTTASQSVTVGTKSYTVAEIATAISAIADLWRSEDIAATP